MGLDARALIDDLDRAAADVRTVLDAFPYVALGDAARRVRAKHAAFLAALDDTIPIVRAEVEAGRVAEAGRWAARIAERVARFLADVRELYGSIPAVRRWLASTSPGRALLEVLDDAASAAGEIAEAAGELVEAAGVTVGGLGSDLWTVLRVALGLLAVVAAVMLARWLGGSS